MSNFSPPSFQLNCHPVWSITMFDSSIRMAIWAKKHSIEEWSFLSLCNSIIHPESSITFNSEQEMNGNLHSLPPLSIHTFLHPILIYIPFSLDSAAIEVIPSPCWIALVNHDSPSTSTLLNQQQHYRHQSQPIQANHNSIFCVKSIRWLLFFLPRYSLFPFPLWNQGMPDYSKFEGISLCMLAVINSRVCRSKRRDLFRPKWESCWWRQVCDLDVCLCVTE